MERVWLVRLPREMVATTDFKTTVGAQIMCHSNNNYLCNATQEQKFRWHKLWCEIWSIIRKQSYPVARWSVSKDRQKWVFQTTSKDTPLLIPWKPSTEPPMKRTKRGPGWPRKSVQLCTTFRHRAPLLRIGHIHFLVWLLFPSLTTTDVSAISRMCLSFIHQQWQATMTVRFGAS